MIVFEAEHIQLGEVVNVAKMPYKFKGISKYKFPVIMVVAPSCGCTSVEKKERILQPEESFEINGNLTKRKQNVKTTKSVNVSIKDSSKKQIHSIRLLFTMDLIKVNDI